MTSDVAKAEVIEAGHELVGKGLVSRTWGNVSCRIDGHSMAITPSGIDYGRLTPADIVVTNLDTLAYEGGIKPSSEKGIHAMVYRRYPGVNFVIHTHQNLATVLSVAGFNAVRLSDMDAARLSATDQAPLGGDRLGGLVLAAYALPGTKRLVRNVEAALRGGGPVAGLPAAGPPAAGPPAAGPPAALLARHGALLCGSGRHEAFDKAVALEELCAGYTVPYTVAIAGTDGCPLGVLPDTQGGTVRSSRGDTLAAAEATAPAAALAVPALHREIYRRYPGVNNILQGPSPAASEALAALAGAAAPGAAAVPAMLDDVAQMAGLDIKIAGPLTSAGAISRAASLLRGRNCLIVRDNAALRSNAALQDTALQSNAALRSNATVQGNVIICCAGTESDCSALFALAQKNCLAFLQARRGGRAKALPLADRLLMRLVYLHKYSKKL